MSTYASATASQAVGTHITPTSDFVSRLPGIKEFLYGPKPNKNSKPILPEWLKTGVKEISTIEVPNILHLDKCKSLSEAYKTLELENKNGVLSQVKHTVYFDSKLNRITFSIWTKEAISKLAGQSFKFMGTTYDFPKEKLQYNWIKLNCLLTEKESAAVYCYLHRQDAQGYIVTPRFFDPAFQAREETFILFPGNTPPPFLVQGLKATRILDVPGITPRIIYYMNPILNAKNFVYQQTGRGKPPPKKVTVVTKPVIAPTSAKPTNSSPPSDQQAQKRDQDSLWQTITPVKVKTPIETGHAAFKAPAFQLPTGNTYASLYDAEDEDLTFQDDNQQVVTLPILNLNGVGDPQRYKGRAATKQTKALSSKSSPFEEDIYDSISQSLNTPIDEGITPFTDLSKFSQQLALWNTALQKKLSTRIALLRLLRTSCPQQYASHMALSALLGTLVHDDDDQVAGMDDATLWSHLCTDQQFDPKLSSQFLIASKLEMVVRYCCPAIYFDDLAVESITGTPTFRSSNHMLSDSTIYSMAQNSLFRSRLIEVFPMCVKIIKEFIESPPPEQLMYVSAVRL